MSNSQLKIGAKIVKKYCLTKKNSKIMGVFIQKKYEDKKFIIEIDNFENVSFVVVTDKDKLNRLETGVVLCEKIEDKEIAYARFYNLILEMNNIKINVTIK